MASSDCPSTEELEVFLADVDAPEQVSIKKHLDGCHSCRERTYFIDPELDHQSRGLPCDD